MGFEFRAAGSTSTPGTVPAAKPAGKPVAGADSGTAMPDSYVNKTPTLADLVKDAAWRKKTAASLDALFRRK